MRKIRRTARVVVEDNRLVKEAVRLGGHRTKKEAVECALKEYIRYRKQLSIIGLFGKIDFDPKYNYKKQRRRR